MLPLKEEAYGTVKAYYLSAAAWFVLGTAIGLIDATHLVAPDLLGNISWLVFGRTRPMHTNLVIFGFVGTALLGSAFYLVPTLLQTPLFSERLGRLSLWILNLTIAAGTITLSLGYSQGREYAEWIWPVDLAVLLTFTLIFYNFLRTAGRRREQTLYVSIWYIFAGLIYSFLIYFFGNAVWNPAAGAITGMPDAVLAWFYGHGVVGLYLTPLAVALAYYIVPLVCRSPLYSHSLSLFGFWTILVIYTHIGTHHLLQTPVPTWLKVVAITGSVGMFIPVLTVLINLFLTMRGRLGLIHAEIGGKFIAAGLVWYTLVCIQGPLQSLPVIQRVTHLNNWVIAHAHMGILGFSGTMALGGIYFILPRITGRPIYSRRWADIQYWLVLIGMAGFFMVLTAAGLIQGNGWLNGQAVYKMLPEIHVYMVLRAAIGVLIVGGAVLGLLNIYRSIYWPRGSSGPAPDRKGETR
ncbi:MAG: cbb3-type cytochrome c oxidase subunit I [Deltaproteobacteria bacterium]|nr:cbb3-type cytochrome c oxidase subunit I [Deltaproteobacteria bacterium]